jgi:hypothetical protein
VFLSDKYELLLLPDRIFLTLFVLVIFVTIPAFAANQDILIPKWFLNVYQYFNDQQISEKEFENAITYLQKIGAIRLQEDTQNDPITNFLVTNSVIEQNDRGHSEFSNCSPDWYITGYFTPIESDYVGRFITVNIDGVSYKFKEDFVTEIKTQGWGKTLSGKYLGWYDESFHQNDFPLDGSGNKLVLNAIAVDPLVITPNSHVMIPTIPSPWNGVVFLASDVGTAIIGKHIDVYTGEGKEALDEAYVM